MLIDTAIPGGLVVNELLSNALKHAFPDNRQGKVSLRLFRNDADNLELCYADDGVGFPAGFDFRGQTTLGLQMVMTIVEHQMLGQVRFANNQGLTCTIEFPDTLYAERI